MHLRLVNNRAICVAALLLVHTGLLAWSGYVHSPTIDEPAHLAAGISHWQFGRFDLYAVNPPLVRMVGALPVLCADPELRWGQYRTAQETRAEFDVGKAFANANGARIFWLMTLARWACIPFSVLGGWYCYRYANELFGHWSGLLALTLWCFEPNILGHGSLITADVPSASLAIASLYHFRKWLQRRSAETAIVAGCVLGIGLLVKSTLILFCMLWPALWMCSRFLKSHDPEQRSCGTEAGQHALILLVAIAVLNAGYGFEGSGTRLGDFNFSSRALSGLQAEGEKGNRFRESFLALLPVPLPRNYVQGIDEQKSDFEYGLECYFLGEVRSDPPGWWYFYLYAAAVKIPLGLWVLAGIALMRKRNVAFSEQLLLIAPAAMFLVLVSSQSGLNFFRYLIPAFPFLFVFVSQAAANVHLRSIEGGVVTVAATWMTVSSLLVYPHSLSYFNELVGGPRNGYRIMVDSNCDWGQDLIQLREWMNRNPASRGMELRYYGPVDPIHAGLDVWDRGKGGSPNPENTLWYATSVTHLAMQAAEARPGSIGADLSPSLDAYLFNTEPDVRIGYSIHVYRIGRSERLE